MAGWSKVCGVKRRRGYAAAREMSEQGPIGDLRDRLSSFRTRLRLFFVLIVIVPMIAVTFIVFRLIAESEIESDKAKLQEGLNVLQAFVDVAPDNHPYKQSSMITIEGYKNDQKMVPQKTGRTPAKKKP